MPCGVVITKKEHMRKMSQDIEYLASKDATIMGSRNGHAAVYMWYSLNRKGYSGVFCGEVDARPLCEFPSSCSEYCHVVSYMSRQSMMPGRCLASACFFFIMRGHGRRL
jgi:hypothetical protein